MNSRTRTWTRLGAVGIAAVLMLSGCSLIPHIPVLNNGDSSSGGDGSNGDDLGDNAFLDHDVPDGFPADVPLPDLDIYYSLKVSDQSWSIVYEANDLESDFNSIVDAFEGAGWEVQMSNSAPDGTLGAFSKAPYQAEVIGVADGGNDHHGPILSFTVVQS